MLGLSPAVISPYVVATIGESAGRRYFLTAETFSSWAAQRLGLVHEVVDRGALELRARQIVDALLQGGPIAQRAAKDLVFTVAGRPTDEPLIEETAARIAELRASAEAREGVAAFLERSEEHTSELQSLMRISYAVFCLKKKKITTERA